MKKYRKKARAPIYAAIYETLVSVARRHKYALSIHGSLQRDLDIVAIPWKEGASDHKTLIAAFMRKIKFASHSGTSNAPHNRTVVHLLVTVQSWSGDKMPVYIDLNLMPVVVP